MGLGVVPLVMPKSEDTEDGPTVQKLPKSNTKKSMAFGTQSASGEDAWDTSAP